MEEGSASDNNYDDNYDKNNYYKFLNSIIHKDEFKSEYDSGEENEQYIYFNQPSEYQYEDDIPTIIVDEVPTKKDKPKSNFYKYFLGSILVVSSAITISYYFSKKKNKNKQSYLW